ncbi:hypothetical protein [Brucella anthropi]|uniref:hypothetical protein n=1 Tax=Brucella anthropi TaxID=529 RepID=UPI003986C834
MKLFCAVAALAALACTASALAAGLDANFGVECRTVPMQGTGPSDMATSNAMRPSTRGARPSWAMPLSNSPSRSVGGRSNRAVTYPQAAPSPQLFRYECGSRSAQPNFAPQTGYGGQ